MRSLSLCTVLRFGVAQHTAHALLSCAEDPTCAIYALTAYTALIVMRLVQRTAVYSAHTALWWFTRIHRAYDSAAPPTAHGLIERRQAHTVIERSRHSASDFHAPRFRRYPAHRILLRYYALHFALRTHANGVFSASLTPTQYRAHRMRQRFFQRHDSASYYSAQRSMRPCVTQRHRAPAYVCDLGAGVTQYPEHRMISAPLSALLGPFLFVISKLSVVCLCVRKHLIMRDALQVC